MTSPNKPERCRTCGKRSPLPTRGVCWSCYYRHRFAVARGETTWLELEQAGLTLPARKTGPKKGSSVETGEGRRGKGK